MELDPAAICSEWRKSLPLTAGGYAEAVDSSWKEAGEQSRTALAQARLAYVFTHAGVRGDSACAAAGAESVARLQGIFWNQDRKGWARLATVSGQILDATIDTYDQAFGLLALAWHYRSTGETWTRAAAGLVVEGLKEAAAMVGGLGYPEERRGAGSAPASPFRRQNPHMHLLEAFLAWHAADPEGPWLALAREIVVLFRSRFRDPRDGSLREFFDAGWKPADGGAGSIREPGHHFEWVWLLRRWQDASGDETSLEDASRLQAFACGRGLDSDGLAFDEIDPEGRVLRGSKLLWPQTELLKARLACHEWTRDLASLDSAREILALIGERYMVPGTALWHNQLDREGRPLASPTRSRLLYHLFIALAEAERLLG